VNGYLLTAVLVALFNYLKTGTKDELPVPLFILLVVVIFFDISVVVAQQ